MYMNGLRQKSALKSVWAYILKDVVFEIIQTQNKTEDKKPFQRYNIKHNIIINVVK